MDCARPDAREARGVVARGDRPGARRSVELRHDVHLFGPQPERVGRHLRADRPVTLPLWRRADPDRDAADRRDAHRRALRVTRLRQRARALLGGLRERDVAHVRDRRLDDAGEADPDPASLGARLRLLDPPLVVAGELERVVEAGLVVARVVEPARGRAVGELVGADQVPPAQLGRVEAEPLRGDRHRPLEREVELWPAEPAIQPRRTAVREHDAVPRGDSANAVGPRQRAVHPVERRRFGCADVRADVLERVVAQREQLAVLGERRLEPRPALGRLRAGGEVLEPVLGPADGNAEVARREPEQDDVGVDGRLDAEASARVGRCDQAQAGSR